MSKFALLIVVLLLSILAAHSHGQVDTPQTETKTRGQVIHNPNRPEIAGLTSARFQSSQPSSPIELYDVWFNFMDDQDGDGYFHKFTVSFDLDTNLGSQQIYVVGSLQGETPLFRTDSYWINGQSGEDSYQTTVLLSQGYPSKDYDLSLAVYSADTDQLIAEFSQLNNHRFEPLYLEDASADHMGSNSVSIYQLGYSLSDDWDNDGFYTHMDIDVDVDAPNQSRWIYIEFLLLDQSGYGELLTTSPTYQIQHLHSSDSYRSQVSLEQGYSPQAYQLLARVYDADSHQLLLESQVPHSSGIPLESFEWDDDWHGGSGSVVEEEYFYAEYGAGGSTGTSFLGLLFLLLIGRISKKSCGRR